MEAGEAIGITRYQTGGYFGGLKGSCNLIGTFLGPLISPQFYLLYGFEKACFIMGGLQILFMIIFAWGTMENEPTTPEHRRISMLVDSSRSSQC